MSGEFDVHLVSLVEVTSTVPTHHNCLRMSHAVQLCGFRFWEYVMVTLHKSRETWSCSLTVQAKLARLFAPRIQLFLEPTSSEMFALGLLVPQSEHFPSHMHGMTAGVWQTCLFRSEPLTGGMYMARQSTQSSQQGSSGSDVMLVCQFWGQDQWEKQDSQFWVMTQQILRKTKCRMDIQQHVATCALLQTFVLRK